jgi:hypothetical protein
MRPRLPRRTFLKISAALGVAAYLQPARGLRLASTLPLPFPHQRFPNAEALLTHRLDFDLLLVPAYLAAELIQRGALQTVPGVPGRAHDPDGAYTIPYLTTLSTILYRHIPPADLWHSNTLWPASPRLVIGLALLRRGYSPNDSHPGHLAQIEKDLLDARLRIVPDPEAGLRSALGDFAVTLSPAHSSPPRSRLAERATREGLGVGVAFPPKGAIAVEHDWIIPLSSLAPEAALSFISNLQRPTPNFQRPLFTLTPLSASTRAYHAYIWKRAA